LSINDNTKIACPLIAQACNRYGDTIALQIVGEKKADDSRGCLCDEKSAAGCHGQDNFSGFHLRESEAQQITKTSGGLIKKSHPDRWL